MDKSHNDPTKEIVILGAGFAGIYTYLELHKQIHGSKKFSITLITDNRNFLFTPTMHEVATGTLAPNDIAQSLDVLPSCCLDTFIEGRAKKIDADKQTVEIESTPDTKREKVSVSYDYLVSALGSTTDYLNVAGAKEHTLPLKNLQDAKNIKNQIIERFERAQETTKEHEKKSLLSFVVVGGGPTGVELAGEMVQFSKELTDRLYPSLKNHYSIALIHAKNRLVPDTKEWLGAYAFKALQKAGVEILLNTEITAVDEHGVKSKDDKKILARTVIWTAGVKANKITVRADREIEIEEQTNRIKVTNLLHTPAYKNIFIAGDQAWICNKEKGQPYPMRAQFAAREGIHTARNIVTGEKGKPLKEFRWQEMGFILSLGNKKAIGEVFGIKISGFPAWWMYRSAFLFKFIGLRAKIHAAIEWTPSLFSPRDIKKI